MITELERRLMDAFHEDAQRARLVHPDASWDDREGRSHLQFDDTRLEPEQRLVPVEESYASVDSPPTSETRNRRRLAMAAAAVVAVIGVAAIATNSPNSDDNVEPAPAVQPTVAPRTETDFLDGEDGLSVTFTVPDGWGYWDSAPPYRGVYHLKPRRGRSNQLPPEMVRFFDVRNVYDVCKHVLVDPPVGPTVDDLVSAFANLPRLATTAAADITVDGYVGKQIEFNVPSRFVAEECNASTFALWQEVGDESGLQYSAAGNTHIQLWILDVGGTRLVIEANSYVSTSPQERATIDEIVASIQISQ